MYDERTRMIEQQLAANESARIRGEQSGMEKGFKQGIEQGKIKTIKNFVQLVRNGLVAKEIAAEGIGITVEEFEEYL